MIEEAETSYMAFAAVISVDSEKAVLEPQLGNVAAKVVTGLPCAVGSWAGRLGIAGPSGVVTSVVDFDIEEQTPEAHLPHNHH